MLGGEAQTRPVKKAGISRGWFEVRRQDLPVHLDAERLFIRLRIGIGRRHLCGLLV